MAVIDRPCSGCFDHQGFDTFRYLLALAHCHNAIRTSSLRNPEPRNLLPCKEKRSIVDHNNNTDNTLY